jgi:hypothetical protein
MSWNGMGKDDFWWTDKVRVIHAGKKGSVWTATLDYS